MALRLLAHVAAVLGLAALGAAIGDFASGPSPLGALGVVVLAVVVAAALHRLYRPGGVASWRSAPARPDPPRTSAPPPSAAAPPRRRPSSERATSAPLWLDSER